MVKVEHQKPVGELRPLEIPEWKWDCVTMDFVTGLPRSQEGHDAIWVIVDRLTKTAHFIAIRTDYKVPKLLSCTSIGSLSFMEFQFPLYLIKMPALPLSFEKDYNRLWKRSFT